MHICPVVATTGLASGNAHGIGNGRGTSNVADSVKALWVIVSHVLLVKVGMALLLVVSMGILLPTCHICAVYVSIPTHT